MPSTTCTSTICKTAALQAKHGEPALAPHILDVMRSPLERGVGEQEHLKENEANTEQIAYVKGGSSSPVTGEENQ
jgi:hypothetical protein